MSAASSSMPHPGSARLTLRALSIWPNEDGPAQRLQIPWSADKDTNACTISLSMRQCDCNRNPWRTQPGKRSSASSTDRRPWPGSRKTGPTLWQGSRRQEHRAHIFGDAGDDELVASGRGFWDDLKAPALQRRFWIRNLFYTLTDPCNATALRAHQKPSFGVEIALLQSATI